MPNSIMEQFDRYNGENTKNLRCSTLLIALNQIIIKNKLNVRSFCANTFLSERVYKNITSYSTENFNFRTLSALFIANNVPLDEAEQLFHQAGYHLNNSMLHRVVRFALENHLSIYEADELLFAKTRKHFYTKKKE